jgi:hypothetical protein
MWIRDHLGFLRKFVDNIKNDTVHVPPSVASRQYAPEAHILDRWAQCFSKNFVQGVYSRSIFSQHDCDPKHLPIVVVTNVEQKHMTITRRGRSNQEKRFTMHVAEADNSIKHNKHMLHAHNMMIVGTLLTTPIPHPSR